VPSFIKIYQAVQKLLVGDRQTDDLISLLSFLESRLKIHEKLNKTPGTVPQCP
jgi:hypothetical protein